MEHFYYFFSRLDLKRQKKRLHHKIQRDCYCLQKKILFYKLSRCIQLLLNGPSKDKKESSSVSIGKGVNNK